MSRYLRIAALAALLAGVGAAAVLYPSRPPERRDAIEVLGPDEEACRTIRESRQRATFTVPETEEPVTVGEVARKHRLELEPLCRANGLPAACGDAPLAAGSTLELPLPAPRRRGPETRR